MAVVLTTIGAFLVVAVGVAVVTSDRSPQAEDSTHVYPSAGSWSTVTEGFLAVATPCCDRASLWDALDTISADGQRARPASLAEAAQWLDEWPYRSRDEQDSDEAEFRVAAQGSEVRCYGPLEDGGVPNDDDDEVVLEALRRGGNCVYLKWKAWAARNPNEPQRERHWVAIDGKGFFRGRVEYWHPN